MTLIINPPPLDKCCMKCGKNINDLLPFGKEGDPLVGNFNGAKLVKTFRSMNESCNIPDDKHDEYKKILNFLDIESGDDAETFNNRWILAVEKFGEKQVNDAVSYDELCSTVSASWECRDCIIL